MVDNMCAELHPLCLYASVTPKRIVQILIAFGIYMINTQVCLKNSLVTSFSLLIKEQRRVSKFLLNVSCALCDIEISRPSARHERRWVLVIFLTRHIVLEHFILLSNVAPLSGWVHCTHCQFLVCTLAPPITQGIASRYMIYLPNRTNLMGHELFVK